MCCPACGATVDGERCVRCWAGPAAASATRVRPRTDDGRSTTDGRRVATDGGTERRGESAVVFGLGPDGAAALAYSATFLTGLVVYALADDESVRFHAAQSVVVFGGLFGLTLLLEFLVGALATSAGADPAVLVGAVSTVVGAVAVLLWLVLLVTAVRGRRVEVPLAGRVAAALV